MTDTAPSPEQGLSSFGDQFPWRKWVLATSVLIGAGLIAGAWVVPTSIQVRIVQFMIPPYSYVCLGLAIIALTELPEPVAQRIAIAIALLGLTVLHVFGYAAAGVPPLLILGVQMVFLMTWIARRQRFLWSLLWMLETLVWIGIAWAQGRLP